MAKKNYAHTDAYGIIGIACIVTLLVSQCPGQFATSSMQPLQALIAQVWPEHANNAGLPMSLMSLFMVPPVVLMGFFTRYIDKKKLIVFGSALFAIGGLLPLVVSGFWPYVFCKCLVGLGTGIVISLPTTIVGFLFTGKKQATMSAVMNAVSGGIAFCVSTLTGILAAKSLRMANWVYLIMVVIVILELLFLPSFPPEKKDKHIARVDENGNKLSIGAWTVIQLAFFFVWKIFAIAFIYMMAPSIERMGGSVVQAGLTTSLMTAFNLIWSFVWIILFRVFKNYILLFGCIMSALSMLMMAIGTSMPYMYAWAILCSCGMTMFYPWYYKTMGSMTPLVWVSTAVAFISVGSYLMQSLALYLFKFLVGVTGSDVKAIWVYVFALAILGIVSAIFATMDKARDNNIYKNLKEEKYGAVEE